MITSGRTGVDITLSSHLEAEVVELRLGWRSRFWAAITGRVRVRRISDPKPGWYIDTGLTLQGPKPRGVIVNL